MKIGALLQGNKFFYVLRHGLTAKETGGATVLGSAFLAD
jgi:hypothetical protein